ncbi:TerD family protein [Streptomyces goshikiensis]|uniref:TerD family protein n=1 Tax=Streptomyces goshikiensis TaxID=1942 RepID=UPI0036A506A0
MIQDTPKRTETCMAGHSASEVFFPVPSHISIGINWEASTSSSSSKVDLDLYAIALDGNNELFSLDYFIHPRHSASNRSIVHGGDNSTGTDTAGLDDEAIELRLDLIDPRVAKVVFPVNIYGASRRGQNLRNIGNVYLRIMDMGDDTGIQVAKRSLVDHAELTDTAMVAGELAREKEKGGEDRWHFRILFTGYPSFGAALTEFGVI